MYGTVEYGFKAGGSLTKEFAIRAELVRDGADGEGDWKVRLYQVYLVSVDFFGNASGLGVWELMLRRTGYGSEGVNGCGVSEW